MLFWRTAGGILTVTRWWSGGKITGVGAPPLRGPRVSNRPAEQAEERGSHCNRWGQSPSIKHLNKTAQYNNFFTLQFRASAQAPGRKQQMAVLLSGCCCQGRREGGGELFQQCAAHSGCVATYIHAPRYLSFCVKLVWRPFSPLSGFYLQLKTERSRWLQRVCPCCIISRLQIFPVVALVCINLRKNKWVRTWRDGGTNFEGKQNKYTCCPLTFVEMYWKILFFLNDCEWRVPADLRRCACESSRSLLPR